MKFRRIVAMLCALCASVVLFSTSTSFAQALTTYRPGDKIPYTVIFSGPNAEKLDNVLLNFGRQTDTPKDQEGPPFNGSVSAWELNRIAPGVYQVTIEIQTSTQSGTYKLGSIAVRIGQYQHEYSTGIPALGFIVDNPAHTPEWPGIKTVEQAPHHP